MSSLEKSTQISNWIYLGLPGFVISAVLLNNVNACGSVQFCTVTIFALLFLVAGFSILLLAGLSGGGIANIGKKGNLGQFMFQGINFSKFLWIIIGIITVLGVSYFVTFWDFVYAPFVGIFLSGLIIFVAFLQTNSILVPIVIHGIYNSIVVVLREGGFDKIVNVTPEIGISLAGSTELGFDIMLQNTLVAPSEEFFKVFALIWIVIILRGKLSTSTQGYGFATWVGVIISTASWTVLHLVQFN